MSRASRPPSSQPIHRSGRGGKPKAARRSFEAIDSIGPGHRRHSEGGHHPRVAPSVDGPDREPAHDGRVGQPVEDAVNQGPSGTGAHLEAGDLAINPIQDRCELWEDPPGDAAAARQKPGRGDAEKERGEGDDVGVDRQVGEGRALLLSQVQMPWSRA